jgi:hypothetical protein
MAAEVEISAKSKFRPSISLLFWVLGRAYRSLNRFFSAKAGFATRSRASSLVVEDREVEVAKAPGVGDGFDFDDFSVCDGEAKDHEEASARSHDDSDCSVYECWLCRASAALRCAAGQGGCAADLCRCAWRHGGGIGAKDYVWVE